MKFQVIFLLCFWFWMPDVQAACKGPIGINEGDCAPDFVLKTQTGDVFRLSNLLGKVVFLHFWATWCPPCEEEMPGLEFANRSLSSSRFQMLAVSIDEEGWKTVTPFIKKIFLGETPSFPVCLDADQKVARSFGTFKVPETFIIDKQGRIVDKVQGTKEWRDPMILHYLKLLGE